MVPRVGFAALAALIAHVGNVDASRCKPRTSDIYSLSSSSAYSILPASSTLSTSTASSTTLPSLTSTPSEASTSTTETTSTTLEPPSSTLSTTSSTSSLAESVPTVSTTSTLSTSVPELTTTGTTTATETTATASASTTASTTELSTTSSASTSTSSSSTLAPIPTAFNLVPDSGFVKDRPLQGVRTPDTGLYFNTNFQITLTTSWDPATGRLRPFDSTTSYLCAQIPLDGTLATLRQCSSLYGSLQWVTCAAPRSDDGDGFLQCSVPACHYVTFWVPADPDNPDIPGHDEYNLVCDGTDGPPWATWYTRQASSASSDPNQYEITLGKPDYGGSDATVQQINFQFKSI